MVSLTQAAAAALPQADTISTRPVRESMTTRDR
jgi:hypothetical protein